MKCIILLTIVALCHSYPYGTGYGSGYGYGSWLGSGKNVDVNSDGSITVTTGNGKIITISKGIGQTVVVDVAHPGVGGGQYSWGYQKYQPSQDDALAQILSQYQGHIGQDAYQQLLGDVNYAVQQGQLGNGIYEALQKWNQIHHQVGPIQGEQLGQQLQQEQIQQLLQHQAGLNQQGYPYGQVVDHIEGVAVPVGVDQQGQIVEKVILQNSQKGYPYAAGLVSGHQGIYGQQSYGGQSAWNTLINSVLYGKGQQQTPHLYDQYGQYQVGSIGQAPIGQLHQIQGQILNHQDQIHQEQVQQHQQQQQILHQQLHHQQQQQQLQGQQQYVQEVQQEVQKEQQHVLGQQQQLQEQQKYNTLVGLLHGGKSSVYAGDLHAGYWQQPGAYYQGGLYGGYGQGIQHHNIPLVL